MIKLTSIVCSAVFALLPCAGLRVSTDEQQKYSSDFEGGILDHSVTRTITYSTRVYGDHYEIPCNMPSYVSSAESSCVVTAGGKAIVYYDRFWDNLVPNYHCVMFGNIVKYGQQTQAVTDMFDELHERMGTDSEGTTVTGFKNGMNSYISSKGYTSDLQRMTGSYHNIDLEALKAHINQDKVAVIFLNGFNVVGKMAVPDEATGTDTFTYSRYKGLHAMLVFGYEEYFYYDAQGGLIQRDTYLSVMTGQGPVQDMALNISIDCHVDDLYGVSIQ